MFSYMWNSNGRDSSFAPIGRRKRNYSSLPLCFLTYDSSHLGSSWSRRSLLPLPRPLKDDRLSTRLDMSYRTFQLVDTWSALLFRKCSGNDTNHWWGRYHIFLDFCGDLRLYHHRAGQCGFGTCQLNGRKSNGLGLKFRSFSKVKSYRSKY